MTHALLVNSPPEVLNSITHLCCIPIRHIINEHQQPDRGHIVLPAGLLQFRYVEYVGLEIAIWSIPAYVLESF
jgi:hypothetical protein